MTFSIAGRCARTGWCGVAIASSSPAVAARCAWVRAGVGAACTQNITDPRLGPALLDLMRDGTDARTALSALTGEARVRSGTAAQLGAPDISPYVEYRQLTAIGFTGGPAAYTGSEALGIHATAQAGDAVAAGNLLATRDVPDAMVAAFSRLGFGLPGRLLGALEAGLTAGGEAGPVRSAGLLVAGEVPWPVVDLRVDWHDDPIGELRTLWQVYEPQLTDYVTRALDPTAAPAYGVPGDP
jgi:uncharacterized Ntn-hydrolase superfamily protein